jgi:hypothetical protein
MERFRRRLLSQSLGSVAKNGVTKKPGPDFSLGGKLEEVLHKSHLLLNVPLAYSFNLPFSHHGGRLKAKKLVERPAPPFVIAIRRISINAPLCNNFIFMSAMRNIRADFGRPVPLSGRQSVLVNPHIDSLSARRKGFRPWWSGENTRQRAGFCHEPLLEMAQNLSWVYNYN